MNPTNNGGQKDSPTDNQHINQNFHLDNSQIRGSKFSYTEPNRSVGFWNPSTIQDQPVKPTEPANQSTQNQNFSQAVKAPQINIPSAAANQIRTGQVQNNGFISDFKTPSTNQNSVNSSLPLNQGDRNIYNNSEQQLNAELQTGNNSLNYHQGISSPYQQPNSNYQNSPTESSDGLLFQDNNYTTRQLTQVNNQILDNNQQPIIQNKTKKRLFLKLLTWFLVFAILSSAGLYAFIQFSGNKQVGRYKSNSTLKGLNAEFTTLQGQLKQSDYSSESSLAVISTIKKDLDTDLTVKNIFLSRFNKKYTRMLVLIDSEQKFHLAASNIIKEIEQYNNFKKVDQAALDALNISSTTLPNTSVADAQAFLDQIATKCKEASIEAALFNSQDMPEYNRVVVNLNSALANCQTDIQSFKDTISLLKKIEVTNQSDFTIVIKKIVDYSTKIENSFDYRLISSKEDDLNTLVANFIDESNKVIKEIDNTL